jgi:hypothetical protein
VYKKGAWENNERGSWNIHGESSTALVVSFDLLTNKSQHLVDILLYISAAVYIWLSPPSIPIL